MPVLEKLEKHKHIPIAIVFKGACALGVELTNLLIEQGAFVILIDEYSQGKKRKVGQLLNEDLFSFIDISGTDSLAESVNRVDYIFYLDHQSKNSDNEISTSEFLERSNTLDKLLQLGVDKESKFLITTSIRTHQILQARKSVPQDIDLDDEGLSYTALEVQRYAENLTWEYFKKGGLDARIIRVGEVLGEGVDLDGESLVVQYIKDAINGQKIIIEGDGLENLYFVHVLDAAYGLVKALFTPKTSGEVYSLSIPQDITVLNLAYKILDLEPRAGGIEFVDKKKESGIEIYKPAPNLKRIGWKAKVSFERALAQTINYAYSVFGKKRQTKSIKEDEAISTKPYQKKKETGKKRRSLKDLFINFFFEVKEEKQPRSVLDNVQYRPYKQETLKDRVGSKMADRIHLTDQKKEKRKYKRSKLKVVGWKVIDFFEGIKRKVKAITLAKLIEYLVVFALFFLVYLYFFVPILRVIYYSGVAYIRTNLASTAFDNWSFQKAKGDLSRAGFALEQIDLNIDRLSYLSIFGFYDKLENLQVRIEDARQVLKGSHSLADIMIPIELYMDTYESNVTLVGDDNLSCEDRTNYDFTRLTNVEGNLDQVEQILSLVDNSVFDLSMDLPLVDKRLESFILNLYNLNSKSLQISESMRIIPSLLSVEEPKTTAILLLDNNKINTKGGEITAAGVFTLDQGEVIEIQLYSASELEVSLTSEQETFVRDDLKLLYPEGNLNFSDLTLLTDDNTFITLVSSSIKSKFGRNVDQVLTLDSVVLEEVTSLIGGVDLSSSKVLNSTNFEEVLSEEGVSQKEILTKVIFKLFNFKREDLAMFSLLASKHLSSKHMQFYSEDMKLNEFLAERGFVSAAEDFSYDGFDIALISDSSNIPQITLETKSTLDLESSNLEYLVEFEQGGEGTFSGIALLRFGSNFEIDDIEASSPEIELASSYADRIYLRISLPSNSKKDFIIKGKSSNVVEKIGNRYNYEVMFEKPSGISYDYSFILDYGKELSLVSAPEGSVMLDTGVRLGGNIDKDLLWKFSFNS